MRYLRISIKADQLDDWLQEAIGKPLDEISDYRLDGKEVVTQIVDIKIRSTDDSWIECDIILRVE